MDDSDRNILAGLRHEACEHHCIECGSCDWEHCNPPGSTRPVSGTIVGEEWYCQDCFFLAGQNVDAGGGPVS